jgi:hypothetical protein
MIHRLLPLSRGLLLVLATASSFTVAAAGTTPASAAGDAQRRYQRETARCETLKPRDALENCLSEASTALAQALPAAPDADPDRYARNALKRCEPLPEPERRECIARMNGQGTSSGSAASGGMLREVVTHEPADAASAASR